MTKYFPYPYSVDPFPSNERPGLVAIGVLGVLSLIPTLSLLCFIIYRLIYSEKYYSTPLRYNQSVILITNLIFADFQQALSFSLELHWAIQGKILAPTSACSAQGWLVQIGDLSSGIFSLAIGLQTFYVVVLGRHIPYRIFLSLVAAAWVFCFLLSIVGPAMHTDNFFVAAGNWCWISAQYDGPRLFLHYIWIFICEFGNIVLYVLLFWVVSRRGRTNESSGVRNAQLQAVARQMLVFPIAYTTLTLPLAAGRMATESGRPPSNTFFIVAGCCMASCGWVDVLLYAFTRRTIVFSGEGANGDIPLIGGNLYGNISTAVSKPAREDEGSITGSQENIVKLERAVQVTVETNGAMSHRGDAKDGGKRMVFW